MDKEIKDILNRLDRIEEVVFKKNENTGKEKKVNSKPAGFDFSLNERNFIKTYGRGLSGPKKFTLLLAYMAQGKTGVNIELGEIISKWNKMKSKDLMGYSFNDFYPTQAKTAGWIDSNKHGTYYLRNEWKKIFS